MATVPTHMHATHGRREFIIRLVPPFMIFEVLNSGDVLKPIEYQPITFAQMKNEAKEFFDNLGYS